MGKGFGVGKLKKGNSNPKAYLTFLLQILKTINISNGNPQVVYPLLSTNLDKLDDNLARLLRSKVTTKLSEEEPRIAQIIATDIGAFSNLIKQFPLGSIANNLEIAITGSQVIAIVFTRETFPEKWARNQNSLGNAYHHRIRGNRAQNLELAIAANQAALEVYTHEAFPEEWAATQNNLGTTYYDRIRGDRAQNLEQAICCYEAALQVRTRTTFPKQWAMLQDNLGLVYSHRIRGDRAQNLEQAICCHEAALQVHIREAFSEQWAGTQNNIGIAYFDRIRGDREQNLELAITALEAALQVYTQHTFPEKWALVQNNLGNAYKDRIGGERVENLKGALTAYKAALQVYTKQAFPERWAATQSNLGNAYRERIRGEQAENMERAIACYENALQVRTRDNFPEKWAETQNNLGIAYRNRIYGERAESLERALLGQEAALQVYTREAFPLQWARTQNSLGFVYRDCKQISEAIGRFRLCLEIHKPTAFPIECLRNGCNLGDTAFDAGRWAEAIEGYDFAIEAVETSRIWVASESCRQKILAKSIGVYAKMVQACINIGQLEKAIEYVERSRSKSLVDLMASNDLYSDGEIPSEVKELLQQYEDLQQRIDVEHSSYDSGNNRELMEVGTSTGDRAAFQAKTQAIATLEAKKQQIWDQLRSLDPVLAGEIKVEAPDFAAMQQLIDQPTTALLSFYTTGNDTHIFVLRQNQISCHTCPGQGIKILQGWISHNWLQPYAASCYPDKPKQDRDQLRAEWLSQIIPFLTELAQRLQLTDLVAKYLDGIEELIIVPHLLLHQIPFAALPIQDLEHRYLGGKFLIRYTPQLPSLGILPTTWRSGR